MLSTSDITALVALVISLIAVVVTATQLSAQLFSTAEGTRKCSKSVLGPWSNSRKPDTRTRWNWRWSEFRYETLYVAPDMSLSSSFTWYPPSESTTTEASEPVLKDTVKDTLDRLAQRVKRTRSKLLPDAILGANDDLDGLLFKGEYQKRGTDKVGWIGFLTFLRIEMDQQAEHEVVDQRKWSWNAAERKGGPRSVRNSQVSWPKIKYVQHSWDFMPADCPKPLASSTVGDIAVLVRRTGMVWKEFKPGEGRMTAEGGPHVISSMEQRGLGIVLQYRCLDDTLNHNVHWARKEREAKQEKKATTTQANSQEARECGNLRKRLSEVKPRDLLQIKDEEAGAGNGGDGNYDIRREDIAANNGINEWFRRLLCWRRSEEDREEEKEEEANGDTDDNITLWNPIRSMNLSQDKMMFGWIPSDPALNIPDFPHATTEECSSVLADLIGDPGLFEFDFVGKYGRDGFNDLLYLAPEALHQRGRGRYRLENRGHSGSVFYKSVEIMALRLKKYSDGEKFIGKTIWQTDIGIDRVRDFAQKFESLTLGNLDLDMIHTYHEKTTEYFRKLEEEHHLQFHKVLAVHFMAVTQARTRGREQWKGTDWNEIKKFRTKPGGEYWRDSELTDHWRTLELLFSYVSDYENFSIAYDMDPLKEYFDHDFPLDNYIFLVEEAWIMLMLRGFLYRELHDFSDEFVEEEYLDRKYYKSKIPVWLG